MMDQGIFWLLVSQTVQVTLLALVVWFLTRCVAKNRPHLAHALWLLVVLKCVTPPIWHSPASPFAWLLTRPVVNPTARQSEEPTALSPVPDKGNWAGGIETNAPKSSRHNTASAIVAGSWQPAIANAEKESIAIVPVEKSSSALVVAGTWQQWIVAIWIASAVVVMLMSLVRFGRFLFWLKQSSVVPFPEIERELERLARKLKIRRRVRLKVMQAPVGPAVLGWIRPTVLLPADIVVNKSNSQLEPLLAHELVHIRRGDLVWAGVQTIARSLFWFHPLVRFAVAMVTRESERSCDEETVASLGCTPADYARGLLDVLEHKHRLRVAPALPGVRPVDITSARLERVMKLGQGSCRRTPMWVWSVFLIGGAAVLPGASMIIAQEEARVSNTEISPSPQIAERRGKPQLSQPLSDSGKPLPLLPQKQDSTGTQIAVGPDGQWMLKAFDVEKLLAKLQVANLKSVTPEQRLLLEFHGRVPGTDGQSEKLDRDIRCSTEDGEIHLGGESPNIKIVNDKLYAFHTRATIEQIEQTVDRLNEHGFRQVQVECRFGTLPRKGLGDLGIDWSMGHSAVAPLASSAISGADETINANFLDADSDNSGLSGVTSVQESSVRAASFVEKSSPVLFALVDDDQYAAVVKRFKELPDSDLSFAPKVRMNNGQSAKVSTGTIRPFVVGFDRVKDGQGKVPKPLQPVIRQVSDGSVFDLNATSNDDQSIDLDCQVSLSRVIAVETAEVPIETGSGKARIQIPEVATSQVRSSMRIPAGKTLVLGSYRDGDDGKKEAFVAIIKCHSIDGLSEPSIDASEPEVAPHRKHDRLNRSRDSEALESDRPQQVPYFLVPDSDSGELRLQDVQSALLSPNAVDQPSSIQGDSSGQLLIRSEEPVDPGVDYQPVYALLEQHGVDLTLEGKVDYRLKKDCVLLTANKISLRNGTDDSDAESTFLISADQGQIEIPLGPSPAGLRAKLAGHANLQEGKATTSADEIEYVEGVSLRLVGDAKAAMDQYQLSADRVTFNHGPSGSTLLEGDGYLVLGESRTELRASRIDWNPRTDACEATGIKSVQKGVRGDRNEIQY